MDVKYRLKKEFWVEQVDDDGFNIGRQKIHKPYSIWQIVENHWTGGQCEIVLEQISGSRKHQHWVGLSQEKFREYFEEIKE